MSTTYNKVSRQAQNLIDRIAAESGKGGVKSKFRDIGKEMATGVAPIVGSLYESQFSGRSKEQTSILDDLDNFSAELIHEKYGGALTRGESKRGARWDPASLGLDDERTIQRLEYIRDVASDTEKDLMADYQSVREDTELIDEEGEDLETDFDALTDEGLGRLSDQELEEYYKRLGLGG